MRECTRCKIIKGDESFTNDRCCCKDCVKNYNIEYKKKNPSYSTIHKRAYSAKHPGYVEKGKERAAAHYLKNREKILNSGKIRENVVLYQKKCRDEFLIPYLKAKAKKRGYTKEQIQQAPEILETIKISIKVKRILKQLKQPKP